MNALLSRPAFTIIELLIVCSVIGIVTAIAAPRVRASVDAFAVESATRDAVNALALGRLAAIRHGGAEVRIDSSLITVRAAGRDLFTRNLSREHAVSIRTTADVVRYAATGWATGLSNGSIIVSRGAQAETVFVSRLGRVRR
jgi:prepilin-type N-terminal cleavage/methylation domain-containing protein